MAKVKDFYGYLNSIAPFETQEDWDNSGMLVGDMNAEVKKAAVVLDITQGANYNQLFTARFRLKRNPVLAPGMSVSVTIGFKPSSEAMSIVPVSALFMKDGQSFVWLYNEQDETIEPVSVAVERLTKDGEAIVRSALRKGQTVISAGVNDLKEGQKVKLLPPVPASNVGGLL